MIKVKDFTNRELINAIAEWLRSGEHFNCIGDYADALESGEWLNYYKDKLQNELPHSNC